MTNWPPSEAIERYKVPSNSRLVIESAYGGRFMTGAVVAPGGDSGVIGLITVHGYLESASNPKPPVLCT
jgi:hypothetical protein